MENCIGTVPIHLKMTLTTKEAAEYSNIGINKIDSMLRTPNCPFVLFVGTKKLVKRKEIEQFISKKTGDIRGSEKFTNRQRVFSRNGLRKRTLYAIIYV